MNPDTPSGMHDQPAQARNSDVQLRQTLQGALVQSAGGGMDDLQARVMSQWALRTTDATPLAGGAGVVLQVGLHSLRVQVVVLALVMAAMLGWQALRNHSDTSLDDLLEPDVLSLMALGEL